MAIDPVYTYIGGIAFLVLIIGTMLYLTFSTLNIDEGDEHPGESVVKGVGVENEPNHDDESEPAEPISEDEPELIEEDPADVKETEEEVSADAHDEEDADDGEKAAVDDADEDADDDEEAKSA